MEVGIQRRKARSVIKRGLERATGLSGDASLGGLFPYSFQVLAGLVISGR